MSARVMDEELIFCEALGYGSAQEQAAYLDRACQGNGELRRRVEALLRARGLHESFLAQPAVLEGVPGSAWPRSGVDASGAAIGPYRLLERIGEGGFGEVYMAEQSEPVRRRVALKIVKPGMDTRQVIARFEAERQALAMMDHPNIARVLDAGATEPGSPLGPGRPYFVMELVKGVPITRFCDEHRLGIRERLGLFIDACRAVQHAHQKGIIHRDLKPSNVLVSQYDDRPVVKIIDFGIAKATGGRLTDRTLFTEFRQMIGTPAYMSPEQAGLSDLDVDTRSDIYSLGVLLYELLTGTTPFEPGRLRSAEFDELRRIIREEEPPRPSTRMSSLLSELRRNEARAAREREGAGEAKGTAAAIAAARRADPRSLQRSLSGEPDWIVMKCLEKDRARRYETASALAVDVERYLASEPVLAGPPSRAYRVRKFVRRHRAAATAGALAALALTAGTAGTTYGLLRAERRRGEAEAAREQTQQIADFQAAMIGGIDAEAMGRGIQERFREQVRAALERESVGDGSARRPRTREEVDAEMAAFDQRAGAARAVDVARGVMDEFVLARAAEALEAQFADQPLVRARLRLSIGKMYNHLGLYGPAEAHLRGSLELRRAGYGGAVNAEVAECLYNLGIVMADVGKPRDAEALFREALAMWRALHGESDRMVARTLDAMSGALIAQGKLDEGEEALQKAIRLNRQHRGENDPEIVSNQADLVVLLTKKRMYPEAEAVGRRVLAGQRALHGGQSASVAMALFNLAQSVAPQGRPEEAAALFRESLSVHQAVYGRVHPLVAKSMHALGVLLLQLGERAEAEVLLEGALAQQRALLGDETLAVRNTLGSLAQAREQRGDFDGAVTLLRESLAIAERMYPDGHSDVYRRYSAMSQLGASLARQAKQVFETDPQRGLELFREADPLIWDGLNRMGDQPRAGGPAGRRQALERALGIYDFWLAVTPDEGWSRRAAEWRAELGEVPKP